MTTAAIGSVAMGLNSYFAFFLVGSMGLAWQTGMAVIFWGSLLFALAAPFRAYLLTSIPNSLRVGIASGCGLFIALIGLHNAHIIVDQPAIMVTPGNPRSAEFVLNTFSFTETSIAE